MSYKQVLVAVDMTEEADEVLAAARELADEFGAQLACVNVVRPLAGIYSGLDMVPLSVGAASLEREAIEQSQQKLQTLAAEYRIAKEDLHVELGLPAAEIRTAAQNLGADLLVIGTHGRHGLGLLLGSTANAVMHGVPCDVLTVKIHPQKSS